MNDTRQTFAQARSLIASDARRMFFANDSSGGSLPQRMFWVLMPTFQALFWYRLSRYCFLRGWRNTARLLFLFNLYHTRVEIPPTTDIGEACLIAHGCGVVLYGTIGKRATIYGDAKIGGGIDNSVDIGAGPGYPIIGDDVTLGYRASVLGAFRVGDRARLGPFALAIFDVPADAKLQARKSVIMQPKGADANVDTPSHGASS